MNKSELIDAIATATDLTKVDAGKALNAITDSITGAMANDRWWWIPASGWSSY